MTSAHDERPAAAAQSVPPLGVMHEAFRYVVVSCIALTCDVATLAALVAVGVNAVVATALGYLVGLGVHYALATRFVFRHRRFAARRGIERSLYVTTGLAGLMLSAAIVAAGVAWGFTLPASKAVAVAASFLAVYAIRRTVLFRKPASRKAADA